jgi:peptidyl-prolyl cis-trans isomerase B (cyclophilin B)
MDIRFTTNKGVIEIELFEEEAPISADNFLAYAKSGQFTNTIFHRVIPNFMIQGGGFEPSMKQKSTEAPIKNEANNGLKNLRGTLSMARTGDPHSATSQFFINLVDNAFLDFKGENSQGWGYAVFGKVTKGMDIVDAIAATKTGNKAGHQDVPLEDIIITNTEVLSNQ